MPYPNRIQAALLFDERFDALEAAGRDFCRIVELKSGHAFAALEGASEGFIQYLSAEGHLAASFELVGGPPPLQPFEGALASPVTGLFAPSIRDALARARSHVLLEVAHLAADSAPDPAAAPDPLAQFTRRLETLALMTRITADQASPSAIHWTQSDQLLTPARFEACATAGLPGPLHVHPHLFGSAQPGEREPHVGVRSFGAAHWLGREIVVEPSALPWQAAYEAILAFLHLATGEGGYVIPHGDTFGSHDGGEAFRVLHREADEGPEADAAYLIVPLRHDPSGFVSREYAASARIVRERGAAVTAVSDQPSEAEPPAARALPDAALAAARRMIAGLPGESVNAALSSPAAPSEAPLAAPAPAPAPLADAPASSPEPSLAAAAPAAAPSRQPRAMIRPVQSHPGDESVSGRSLRARVFGRAED